MSLSASVATSAQLYAIVRHNKSPPNSIVRSAAASSRTLESHLGPDVELSPTTSHGHGMIEYLRPDGWRASTTKTATSSASRWVWLPPTIYAYDTRRTTSHHKGHRRPINARDLCVAGRGAQAQVLRCYWQQPLHLLIFQPWSRNTGLSPRRKEDGGDGKEKLD